MRSREAATNTHADIHEQDLTYLKTCRETGRAAAIYYGWKIVECVRDGEMRSIEDIHEEIYSLVTKCLEE
jgi:dTMP kinase